MLPQTLVPLGDIFRRPPFKYIGIFKEYLKSEASVLSLMGIELEAASGRPAFSQLVRSYEEWVASVKRSVPVDQLLVHTATDGYAPLSAFLGVAAPPDNDYPR